MIKQLIIILGFCLMTPFVFAADYPLYVRFIPYNPPNLHLRTTRATNAYYLPGVNPGTNFSFRLSPVLGSTLSLAAGPIPIVLQFFNGIASCRGSKVITATIRYNISSVNTVIGAQTLSINVTNGGSIIKTLNFNGISSAQSYVLQSGDYVELLIRHETSGTGQACIVNEVPLNGTDADSSKVTLQTGPMLTVQKLRSIIFDPVNGITNPKSIPGAVVRYTINISNDTVASATANSVDFTDDIPANTQYKVNSITLNSASLTDAIGDDAGEISGTTITVDTGVILPSQTKNVTYDVIIN